MRKERNRKPETLVVRGRHEVMEVLKTQTKIESVMVSASVKDVLLSKLRKLAGERKVVLKELPNDVFIRRYGDKSQGVVAICGAFEYSSLEELVSHTEEKNGIIVALNQVEDPRNLGAIVRTIEVASCAGVIIPKHRSASMTEWAIKTAQGAASHTKVARVGNLADALNQLKKLGFWIVGLDGDGEKLYTDFMYTDKTVLVAGGENVGLGERVKKTCDDLVRIPVLGHTNSLNVSVSVGVAVYEVLRQRKSQEK